jgi:hypothetical protein
MGNPYGASSLIHCEERNTVGRVHPYNHSARTRDEAVACRNFQVFTLAVSFNPIVRLSGYTQNIGIHSPTPPVGDAPTTHHGHAIPVNLRRNDHLARSRTEVAPHVCCKFFSPGGIGTAEVTTPEYDRSVDEPITVEPWVGEPGVAVNY